MQRKAFLDAALILVLAALISSIIILSFVPPVSRDALVHHLNIPKLYLQSGKIYEMPSMPFSYFPMNLDLIYMIPLYFGNDIVPKLIHFGFALFTGMLILFYLKRRLNITYALFGSAFFLSLPIIIKLSITAYVDLGLIFFSTASLLLLIKWIETGFRLRFLLFSAIFCGLAMGTKPNGLISCFLLTLFVPFLYSRSSREKKYVFPKAVGFVGVFLAVALLAFSPWMIRNYQWRGNPIYPLYDKYFNPPALDSKKIAFDRSEENGAPGLFGFRSIHYGESWWQIALLPIRLFFEGKDGRPQYFDGKLNPFLLILPIFAFWRNREEHLAVSREKKVLLAFSVLFFAFAFFSTVLRIRYFSPILPPLVILSVFGVRNIIGSVKCLETSIAKKIMAAVLGFAVILLFGTPVLYLVSQFKYVRPVKYLSGNLSRDGYISEYCPEYPAMKYVNENLPLDVRLLFMFIGKRGYYCDRDYIPDTAGELNRLYKVIINSSSHKEVARNFRKRGITHLVVNINLLNKWVNNLFRLEKRKWVIQFFADRLIPVYATNGIVVFELKES